MGIVSAGIGSTLGKGVAVVGGSGGGGSTPGPSYDSDAQTYFTAVEAEDGEALESGVKDAINAFVVGCKADGIWSAIKASCILAGARTLDGALIPLVGTAPTNVNFVSGDYSRTGGLTGNGSTKYLNTNVPVSTAGTQNNLSFSVFMSSAFASNRSLIGANTTPYAFMQTSTNATTTLFGANGAFSVVTVTSPTAYHLPGVSRSASDSYTARWNGVNYTVTNSSTGTIADNFFVFARNNNGTPTAFANNNICWYHVGESLNLEQLESRVSTLITAIGAALE